ncbi:hypothetical protein GCM10023201_31550 [Actinomycetospora corticicola]
MLRGLSGLVDAGKVPHIGFSRTHAVATCAGVRSGASAIRAARRTSRRPVRSRRRLPSTAARMLASSWPDGSVPCPHRVPRLPVPRAVREVSSPVLRPTVVWRIGASGIERFAMSDRASTSGLGAH